MKYSGNMLQEKYYKRKQKCKQSDGDSGSYVLSYTDKKGKKHSACHTSKKNMQGQIAAIEAEADETFGNTLEENIISISEVRLRKIIRESISQYVNDDRVEHHPKRDELMDVLHKELGLKSRTTEEFGGSPGGVWISGESNVPETAEGLPMFDYYLDMDPYEFGVHPDFVKFVGEYGFFPEWNDPGTLMLWRM